MRDGTALWPDLKLSPNEASNERLTSEIASATAVIERETGDVFEQKTNQTLTLPVTEFSSFVFTSGYRLTAIGAMLTVDNVGTEVAVEASRFRFHSWGIERVDGYMFPFRSVKLTGVTYGWAATPSDIKRATAMLVYDQLKGQNASRMRATRWQAGDAIFERSENGPTGIPEVDLILARYSVRSPRIGAA